jgi:hypothetical protein
MPDDNAAARRAFRKSRKWLSRIIFEDLKIVRFFLEDRLVPRSKKRYLGKKRKGRKEGTGCIDTRRGSALR